MISKLHTSIETKNIYGDLAKSLGLQPYILAKISIALSVRKGLLSEEDFQTNNDGLELSRTTIFGEYDTIYKAVITAQYNRTLYEDEYFPKVVKAHIDRGAKILRDERRYSKDFYNHMCHLDDNL